MIGFDAKVLKIAEQIIQKRIVDNPQGSIDYFKSSIKHYGDPGLNELVDDFLKEIKEVSEKSGVLAEDDYEAQSKYGDLIQLIRDKIELQLRSLYDETLLAEFDAVQEGLIHKHFKTESGILDVLHEYEYRYLPMYQKNASLAINAYILALRKDLFAKMRALGWPDQDIKKAYNSGGQDFRAEVAMHMWPLHETYVDPPKSQRAETKRHMKEQEGMAKMLKNPEYAVKEIGWSELGHTPGAYKASTIKDIAISATALDEVGLYDIAGQLDGVLTALAQTPGGQVALAMTYVQAITMASNKLLSDLQALKSQNITAIPYPNLVKMQQESSAISNALNNIYKVIKGKA